LIQQLHQQKLKLIQNWLIENHRWIPFFLNMYCLKLSHHNRYLLKHFLSTIRKMQIILQILEIWIIIRIYCNELQQMFFLIHLFFFLFISTIRKHLIKSIHIPIMGVHLNHLSFIIITWPILLNIKYWKQWINIQKQVLEEQHVHQIYLRKNKLKQVVLQIQFLQLKLLRLQRRTMLYLFLNFHLRKSSKGKAKMVITKDRTLLQFILLIFVLQLLRVMNRLQFRHRITRVVLISNIVFKLVFSIRPQAYYSH